MSGIVARKVGDLEDRAGAYAAGATLGSRCSVARRCLWKYSDVRVPHLCEVPDFVVDMPFPLPGRHLPALTYGGTKPGLQRPG